MQATRKWGDSGSMGLVTLMLGDIGMALGWQWKRLNSGARWVWAGCYGAVTSSHNADRDVLSAHVQPNRNRMANRFGVLLRRSKMVH